MSETEKSQVVIVNMNPADSNVQIIIPPFRPVSLYEIEDSFDEICEEIQTSIHEPAVADSIIEFVSAFKETLDDGDILPLMEYFGNTNIQNLNVGELRLLFDSLRDFLNQNKNKNRLMH